ncbi:tRNA glutamyl-Q synthetase [Echinicola marina]|uniref:glutamate--tRNA ligase family protein n=1 Tax=Echinicola marina TaxID=2859768 RepID=UPI001CF6FA53|nr:glutamate--tRNA ligase family protein [Echinicola marina]UCS93026.1 tRNA glutamyl-Q synthetase [Echinicola marina]
MTTPQTTYHLTRIAPTPSGYLHLGNILSFLITSALAKKYQSKVLLRIDDLDQSRVRQAYIEDIFVSLDFLEIPWDLGPRNTKEFNQVFSQTKRLKSYEKALHWLSEQHMLFACECSRKQIAKISKNMEYPGTCLNKGIPLDAENNNWRLITNGHSIHLKSLEGGIYNAPLPSNMRHFVVRKKTSLPAYQLASVVDDINFGVDLIVRGQDLLDSSLAQTYLSTLLPTNNYSDITFFHHRLMMHSGNKKLSKSKGATSIQGLREMGKSKSDIYHSLGDFMGFKEPIFSLDDFINAYIEKAG